MSHDEFTVLTDNRSSDGYPVVVVDKDNRVWVVWQSYRGERDSIFARSFDGSSWSEETQVSAIGGAFKPKVGMNGNGKLGVVWSVLKDGCGDVFARFHDGNTWSGIAQVTDSSDACDAVICGDGQTGFWFAWNSLGKRNDIFVRHYDGRAWSPPVRVTVHGTAYRPAIALDRRGRLWVLFDAFLNGTYDVFATHFDGTGWSPEVKLSSFSRWSSTADVCTDGGNGLWTAWVDLGECARVTYHLRHFDGKAWLDPLTIGPFPRWNAYSSIGTDAQGRPFVGYNWGRSIHVRSIGDGELTPPAPIYSSFSAHDRFSRRCSIAVDNAGQLWAAWQSSFGNGCLPRNADIWVRCVSMEQLRQLQSADAEIGLNPFIEASYRRKAKKDYARSAPGFVGEHGAETPFDQYRVFFGDIHGQAKLSDGLGEVDQYYRALKHRAKMDFGALTEHDAFPDVITESEWKIIKAGATAFNDPPHFVTFLAFEWTPNENQNGDQWGHKNVYYLTDDGPILRGTDPKNDNPEKLFNALKNYRALVFPHHPAAGGGWKAGTDWDYHDPELQRVVEIFSIHGPFEYYGNASPYTKNVPQQPSKSFQDALARGYRMGVIGGSDTHQLEPGIEGGLMAAYAKELSRQALFEALYERRVYATTGTRILLRFLINGIIMGQEMQALAGEPLSINVAVSGTDKIKRIDVVKDGKVVAAKSGQSPIEQLHFSDVEDQGFEGTRYYYARVTQDDDHMAWSSPIWVTYPPSVS